MTVEYLKHQIEDTKLIKQLVFGGEEQSFDTVTLTYTKTYKNGYDKTTNELIIKITKYFGVGHYMTAVQLYNHTKKKILLQTSIQFTMINYLVEFLNDTEIIEA